MLKFILTFLFFGLVQPSFADDSSYNKVRDTVFWAELYNNKYTTLYCGIEKKKGSKDRIEHIYPANWIARSLGCQSRKDCKFYKYREASSDLHNLWPALQRFNSSRGNLPFGEIIGEVARFKTPKCDFERTTGKDAVVEPRDEVKGQIARSYLYMVHRYDLPTHDILPLMVKWNKTYPPSKEEITRHNLIERNQGRSNPFIEEY